MHCHFVFTFLSMSIIKQCCDCILFFFLLLYYILRAKACLVFHFNSCHFCVRTSASLLLLLIILVELIVLSCTNAIPVHNPSPVVEFVVSPQSKNMHNVICVCVAHACGAVLEFWVLDLFNRPVFIPECFLCAITV